MKGRSTASRKPAKRRKTVAVRGRDTSKAVPSSSDAMHEPEVARLTRERDEALEREKASAEVLSVISSSPGDLELVFDTMLANAARLCEAHFGILTLYESGIIRVGARYNMPIQRGTIIHAQPSAPISRVVATKDFVHIIDLSQDVSYQERDSPVVRWLVDEGRVHSILVVPMLRKGELIGALSIYRQEISPFTDKQIELVKSFASQAVIAIENTRLLNELCQRSADLTEALEQQTATSEVLRVISSSPGDLKPVFETMLASAARICDARVGGVYRWDGEFAQLVATTQELPPAYAAVVRYSAFRPDPKSLIGRSVVRTTAVQFADFTADELYTKQRDPFVVANVELGGLRTGLFVPMLKGTSRSAS